MADTRVASGGRDGWKQLRLNSGAMNCANAPREGSAAAFFSFADAKFKALVHVDLQIFCTDLGRVRDENKVAEHDLWLWKLSLINFLF